MYRKFLPEDYLTCPVCYDIFTDPVVLSCTHSICKTCLFKTWSFKHSLECPVCRRRSSKDNPPINLALKNLCEAFLVEQDKNSFSGHKELCSQHKENLKLFCLTDEEPICLVCQTSRKHTKHSFCPIDEAAVDRKEELNSEIEPLKQKLGDYEVIKQTLIDVLEHIKIQSKTTERTIKQEVNKLYEFLHAEEASRIAALREEEKQKSKDLKSKIKKINEKISDISDVISTIERSTGEDDVSFLKNFKFTVKRTQDVKRSPDSVPWTLINVSKPLENLNFRLWSEMHKMIQYYPVTLDPNTAHDDLLLSENLTRIGYQPNSQQNEESPKKCPPNPERFKYSPRVLGFPGFDSGTHYWDVEVGDNEDWVIGLMTETKNGVCELSCNGDEYDAWAADAETICLTFSPQPQIIRVQLDYEGGIVHFSDMEHETSLYTFRYTFTKRVFPFFQNCYDSTPLKILPISVSVTINQNMLPEMVSMPIVKEPLYDTVPLGVINEPIYENFTI